MYDRTMMLSRKRSKMSASAFPIVRLYANGVYRFASFLVAVSSMIL